MEELQIPGKIILFGEYTILVGSRVLATPLHQLSGQWKFTKPGMLVPYQKDLLAFGAFLQSINPQLSFNIQADHFLEDISNGMYFHSNIPVGYGAGSSGAIVAAVCKKYGDHVIDDKIDLSKLRTELGLLESHFHGSSSGTDPLISFLNQPLLIDQEGMVSTVDIPKSSDITLFLLDTSLTRKTSPLVSIFKEKMIAKSYAQMIQTQLSPTNNLGIDQFLDNDVKGLKDSFQKISEIQYEHFQEMIPDFLKNKWKDGLGSELYCLKLCGAGGGGFLLGMTNDFEQTRSVFNRMSLIPIVF